MKPPNRRLQEAEERAAESRRILESVARESETIGSSSFARTAQRARNHFSGADAPTNDPAEIWGRRIGRALGLIAVGGLVLHILFTYVLK